MNESLRLPDFIIIGFMKSGTTSLFRWLGEQPEVEIPPTKEPNFFSEPAAWAKGPHKYASTFGGIPLNRITGEASVSYTHPRHAESAATRIQSLVPRARLICVARDPVDRMRSHYRHEVQRGRERRPFLEALLDSENPYYQQSLYTKCLKPYISSFPPSQLLLVRFDDLFGSHDLGWRQVLAHLDLPFRAMPSLIHNVGADKRGFTPLLRWLWSRGLDRSFRHLPKPIRRLGGLALTQGGSGYQDLIASSNDPISERVVDELRQELIVFAMDRGNHWPDLRA
jgi:hypothetical protein